MSADLHDRDTAPRVAGPVPLVIGAHAGVTLFCLLMMAVGPQSAPVRENPRPLVLVALFLAALYAAMFRRRGWARMLLALVTLPVGLLLLTRSARRFTGSVFDGADPDERRIIDS